MGAKKNYDFLGIISSLVSKIATSDVPYFVTKRKRCVV